jgi:hypothetical protein
LLPRVDADDGTGLELAIEPWREKLWSTVEAVLGKPGTSDSIACSGCSNSPLPLPPVSLLAISAPAAPACLDQPRPPGPQHTLAVHGASPRLQVIAEQSSRIQPATPYRITPPASNPSSGLRPPALAAVPLAVLRPRSLLPSELSSPLAPAPPCSVCR